MSIQGRKIQAKKSKNDLESTADKVRLLKERQSQWMKEREEAKGLKPLGSAKSLESIGERAKRTSARSSSIPDLDLDSSAYRSSASKSSTRDNLYSNPKRKPLYTLPKRDHSNIVTWSNKGDAARIKRPPSGQSKKNVLSKTALESSRSSYSNTGGLREKTYEPSNYKSSVKNLDDSVKDSFSRSSYSKLEPIAGNYDSKTVNNGTRNDHDAHEEIDMSHEFSHQDESHVPKLKVVNEKIGGAVKSGLDQDMIDALAETVAQRLKTTIKGKEKDSHRQKIEAEDNEEMSTHLCSLCNSLMSGSRHTPMALIPCGHTLCQVCLRDCKKCPTCQSRISSSAVNTVLQQIIADFMAQKEKKRLEKMEMETRKYVDEYQSLSLRSNALAEEADAILNGMEDLTEELFQEKKMYKKIQVNNEELTKKIQELQNQLEKNKIRLTESNERCENLESQYEEEKQRLALVEDTVKTIRQSKERVKMLVHNFAPSLNLEQFD